ncbi:MAG: ankyrin repeat domain-containing protein [Candidatus Babeliaceae bacterium]|jgi:hypothetical protein
MKKVVVLLSCSFLFAPHYNHALDTDVSNKGCCDAKQLQEDKVIMLSEELFYAIDRADKESVEKLVECGADVNSITQDGATPLMFAIAKCSMGCDTFSIIEHLLHNNANPHATVSIDEKTYNVSEFSSLCAERCKIIHQECEKKLEALSATQPQNPEELSVIKRASDKWRSIHETMLVIKELLERE